MAWAAILTVQPTSPILGSLGEIMGLFDLVPRFVATVALVSESSKIIAVSPTDGAFTSLAPMTATFTAFGRFNLKSESGSRAERVAPVKITGAPKPLKAKEVAQA